MTLPRSSYVQEGQEGVYHCFSRCVRRAFLCGLDALTGRDFSHRKVWLVERLRDLTSLFAIEAFAYAVMANHWHAVLRTRPDLVASWSDQEVATRWLTLFPTRQRNKRTSLDSIQDQICALSNQPERIAQLRKRLSSLSWLMGRLNEFIARAANKEDGVKGRFWEGRFKCQILLDEAAIAGCMVYVDLNPIRSGVAATPEESNFTSIQQRIRAWYNSTISAPHAPTQEEAQQMQPASSDKNMTVPENTSAPDPTSAHLPGPSDSWLCPIHSGPQRRGILEMTEAEYFDLVDRSGRMVRSDKRGFIDADLDPILNRIGAIPKAWANTVLHFGSAFWLAAGRLVQMRSFADRLDKCWFKGLAAARSAFF